MKKILKILAIIVIVIIVLIVCFGIFVTRGLESGGNLVINNVNLSTLNDDIYIGEYDGGRWSNEVEVTIKNHKIININIINDVTFPMEEVKVSLFNNVIEKQNLDVDIMTGATVTCKAYLKSIENALEQE